MQQPSCIIRLPHHGGAVKDRLSLRRPARARSRALGAPDGRARQSRGLRRLPSHRRRGRAPAQPPPQVDRADRRGARSHPPGGPQVRDQARAARLRRDRQGRERRPAGQRRADRSAATSTRARSGGRSTRSTVGWTSGSSAHSSWPPTQFCAPACQIRTPASRRCVSSRRPDIGGAPRTDGLPAPPGTQPGRSPRARARLIRRASSHPEAKPTAGWPIRSSRVSGAVLYSAGTLRDAPCRALVGQYVGQNARFRTPPTAACSPYAERL